MDVKANRRARKWSRKDLAKRFAWEIARLTFPLSPRVFWGYRTFLLRAFGAKIGHSVHIYPSTRIAIPWNLTIANESAIGDRAIIYNLGPIEIGSHVTISQGAHLCAGTHDYSDPAMPLQKLGIQVEDDVWVCADAFVGPGLRIAHGAVVGARAVVTRDVAEWSVNVGNPSRQIKKRMLQDATGRRAPLSAAD